MNWCQTSALKGLIPRTKGWFALTIGPYDEYNKMHSSNQFMELVENEQSMVPVINIYVIDACVPSAGVAIKPLW